jgi:hypothetical protein
MPPVPSADLEEGLVHPPLHQHPPWTPITSDPTAKQVISSTKIRPWPGRGRLSDRDNQRQSSSDIAPALRAAHRIYGWSA